MFLPGSGVALRAAVAGVGRGPAVTTAVDRQLVQQAAAQRSVRAGGPALEVLPVDDCARVAVQTLTDVVRPSIGLLALQVGNPEVGTLQPVGEAHDVCRGQGVPLLLDATMAAGRLPLPDHWDALVLDARSWAGGDDVGVVVLRPGVRWHPAEQPDSPLLPLGAPSVAACAAAALGLEQALADLPERLARDTALTDRLRTALGKVRDLQVHGEPHRRLPHVVGFSALYLDAEALLLELDRVGISVASGSACAVDSGAPSHVLAAMGALTSGNIRVTLPMTATDDDVDRLLDVVPPLVGRMRAEVGL